MTLWPAARAWTALLVVVVAVATGVVGFAVCAAGAEEGEDAIAAVLGVAHVLAALWVLANPSSLAVQVGVGALLAATPLLGTDGTAVGVVPVVVGVVATAELLGVCGRLGMVVPRDPAPDRNQVGVTTLGAALASGLTLGVGALAGPVGLVAVVLGAGACAGLAVLLAQSPEDRS